eukprot:2023-Heterococcus_DN1.PRE.1
MMRRPALAAAVVQKLAPLLQQCATTATTATVQAVQTLASRATALCTSIAPGCKLPKGPAHAALHKAVQAYTAERLAQIGSPAQVQVGALEDLEWQPQQLAVAVAAAEP